MTAADEEVPLQWPLDMFRRNQGWALVKPTLSLGVVILMAVALHACASRGAAPPPPPPPEPDFVAFSDPAGRVSIEYPKENWQSEPGSAPTVATFTQQDGEARVILAQTPLNQALRPEQVTDVFGQIETETIKEREPNASEFETRLLEDGNRRVVVVQYQRPGPEGIEVVRQYSYPVAKTLYRLTCVMKADQLEKQEPICSHMAASFTVSGS